MDGGTHGGASASQSLLGPQKHIPDRAADPPVAKKEWSDDAILINGDYEKLYRVARLCRSVSALGLYDHDRNNNDYRDNDEAVAARYRAVARPTGRGHGPHPAIKK